MIGIILVIVFIVLIVLAFIFHENFEGLSITIAIISVMGLLIFGFGWFFAYDALISREADYVVLDNKIELIVERNKNTVEQLKFEAQKYINYEEQLFRDLKPENANMLFNAYPNLRTIETIRFLMEQITRYNDEKFALQLSREELRAKFIMINNNKLIPFRSDFE